MLSRAALLILSISVAAPDANGASDPIGRALERSLAGIEADRYDIGFLYDRVLPLSGLERFDGSLASPPARARTWFQICDELSRSDVRPPRLPGAADLRARASVVRAQGAIPLGIVDLAYERLRPEAFDRELASVRDGRVRILADGALARARVVAASVLSPIAIRTGRHHFVLDPELFLHEADEAPAMAADFDDGLGYRDLHPGERIEVRYDAPGSRTIRVRVARADGSSAHAAAAVSVVAAAPLPEDTLHVTGAVPYLGSVASGRAYVALAPGRVAITNPIVVVEGFDLDNTMDWDPLYQLLNQQNLLEDLRGEGFDVIVLDFADATDYIQRNAHVVAALIEQVEAVIDPQATLAVVGASMGGLCSRYALAHLETLGGHRVRTWLSFDAPHAGANIPLGVQYWLEFFSGQSADAAFMRDRLNQPAARQMLLYHYTDPPTAAAPDPLRASLLSELAGLGDYPSLPRRVALANGSGTVVNQGFASGAQIVRYEFSNLLVDIVGNVWALPDGITGNVFQGRIRILLSDETRTVPVSGTLPWDGAPGGSRATMAQMDSTTAPYGDIVALHPAHAFIPTVSALAIGTLDPFYDIAGDPMLLEHTPFEAVFYPVVNEGHVTLSAAGAAWVANELRQGMLGVPETGPRDAGLALGRPEPNPSTGITRFAFTLPRPGSARVSVVGIEGRRFATLIDSELPGGRHEVRWDGRDDRGKRVPPGVCFVVLETADGSTSRRVVRLH